MNKKAQFFSIYLVLLTLFMCFLEVGIYYYQSKQIGGSVVSPVPVLEMQDQYSSFEMQEKSIICKSAEDIGWQDKDFENKFKASFFRYLIAEEQKQFRDFLFSDLLYDEQVLSLSNFPTEHSKLAFFENIYDIDFSNNQLKITRKRIGKHLELTAPKKSKINFPVNVNWKFEREYLLKEGDC